MGKGHAVKDFGPLRTSKMGLGVEAGDGIPLLPLPQHDSKGLVVPPATSQVDVCIQEVTNIGRKHVTNGTQNHIERILIMMRFTVHAQRFLFHFVE